MDESFRQKLIDAKTPREFLDIIDKQEALKDAQEKNDKMNNLYRCLLYTSI